MLVKIPRLFPGFSLTGSQKNSLFLNPHVPYLQKEVKEIEPDRYVLHIYLLFHNAKRQSTYLLTIIRATTLQRTMSIVNENDMPTK